MHQLLPASLKQRRPGRIRPQLDGIREALCQLGDPQLGVPSVLVVGSNGKGSTAAMLEAILSAHGLTVGLYTSPHLIRVEERIRINGAPIAGADLERHLRRLEAFPGLTFFETVTVAAFMAFADRGVDCAVLEAGMGGRWDATRAADSPIAGLTNVGSDHAAWLGASAEDRAADKGAALVAASRRILGSGVDPALVRHLGDARFDWARHLVSVAPIGRSTVRVGWDGASAVVATPFLGDHQTANLELALALARAAVAAGLLERLDPDAVRVGLERTHWPGRLSRHRIAGRRVLLDCAHNAEGAAALARYLERGTVLYHLLFSCLDDKPVREMARALRPHVGNVALCPLDDDRAMPRRGLREAFPEASWRSSVTAALRALPDPVVAAGSIRLVGELLAVAEEEVSG
jgi:dihydrofolate synthase/folylpolyglutamate synthase